MLHRNEKILSHSYFTISVVMTVIYVFKNLFDKTNDKIKFDITPKTNEEYIPVTYGCIGFIDSYWFLSNSLDSLVETLVDHRHKKFQNLKKENVGDYNILNIGNEIEKIISKGENNETIEKLKKNYPNEINKTEALNNYMGGNDPKIWKTELLDKWKKLSKNLAYSYEYFDSIEVYQKTVINLKKKDFSNLKFKCPTDKEVERTKKTF